MARTGGRHVARGLLVLVLAAVVGVTAFVGGLLAAPLDVRAVPPAPKPVLLLGADGTQFGQIRPTQRREVLPAEEIPEVVRQAIISAEDARFLDHGGVDPLATLRAAYRDLTGGRRQGGSTITQQYVKNVYVGNDRTFGRKLREASVAVRLEHRKSQGARSSPTTSTCSTWATAPTASRPPRCTTSASAVQELGLPSARRGRPARPRGGAGARVDARRHRAGAVGVEPGARLRPGARPAEVHAQPDGRRPASSPRRRPARRTASEAAVVPKRVTPPDPPSTAPEYADIVTAQLQRAVRRRPRLRSTAGGLRVRTALDTDLQEAVTRAAREVLPDQDDPQAAVVAVDISSGDVTRA